MATPQRRPDGAQRIGHVPMAVRRCPGEWPRFNGGQTGPRQPGTPPRRPNETKETTTPHGGQKSPGDGACPHGGNTGPKGPATPQRRPYGVQGTGNAPTAAKPNPDNRPRPTAARGTQRIGNASTAAIRGPGDRLGPHGGHTRPKGPATPPRLQYGA